jgi:hypothetical protein
MQDQFSELAVSIPYEFDLAVNDLYKKFACRRVAIVLVNES